MSNLLADPSLWTISTYYSDTPVLSTNVWTGYSYDFSLDGYFGTFTLATPAQAGELKGTFVTDEFGLPGEPSYLVVLRTSDAWPSSKSPRL